MNKTLSKWSGFEELNKQKLEGMQSTMLTFMVIAGISGSLGIGLAIAGKSKAT